MKKELMTLAVGTVVLAIKGNSAQASGFIEDSTAKLELRNLYYGYDTRDTHRDSVSEWGQGFIFNGKSGFTEGQIGLGLDVIAGLGIKLDAPGPGSVFPRDFDGEAVNEFSHFGLQLKLALAKQKLAWVL